MIRHRWILLIAALLVSWPAAAQDGPDHPFYPLDIGDTWEYELAHGAAYEPVDLVSYQRRTVLRDTLIDGEAYRLVRVDSVSAAPGHEALAETLCAVRVTDSELVEWVAVAESGEGTCWAPEMTHGLILGRSPFDQATYVNGVLYDFEMVGRVQGSLPNRQWLLSAAGFGLVMWMQGEWDRTGWDNKTVLRAIYAQVGEDEFGHPIGSDAWKEFYSLSEGDVREYRYTYNGPEGGDSFEYERWDIGADTTIDGLDYTIVRQRRFDEAFEQYQDRSCALRLTDAGGVQSRFIRGGGSCSTRWPGQPHPFDLRTNTWTIEPEQQLGATMLIKDYVWYDEFNSWTARVAEGIGVIWTHRSSPPDSHPVLSYDYDLVFAVVGDATYGSPLIPVGLEEEAAPVSFAIATAFPNPFRSTVSVSLMLPTGEAVTLETFDTLGRRVQKRDLGVQPAGPSQHTIDLSATPVGVYFVRATTATGRTAIQRLVHID